MLIFILSIVAASGLTTDDQSLMQQHLGIESSALQTTRASEFRSAIDTMKESMHRIQSGGKMRQMAMDALLNSLSETEAQDSPDAYQLNILNQIIALLDSILAEFLVQRDTDQAIIYQVRQAVELCDNTSMEPGGIFDQATNAFNSAIDEHEECRSDELYLWQQDDLLCTALTTYLVGLTPPDCTRPDSTYAAIVQWNDLLERGFKFFNETRTEFESYKVACVDATLALQQKHTECNGKQGTAEVAYCTMRSTYQLICNSLDACWDAANHTHITNVVRIRPINAQMIVEAKMIFYIRCLVNNIIDGVYTIEGCVNWSQQYDPEIEVNYSIDFIPTPPKRNCSTLSMDACDTDFQATTYAEIITNWTGISSPLQTTLCCA